MKTNNWFYGTDDRYITTIASGELFLKFHNELHHQKQYTIHSLTPSCRLLLLLTEHVVIVT